MRLLIFSFATVLVLFSPVAAAPRTAADIPPVWALVKAVMGDLGTPDLLLDPGTDPHHGQLRPSTARAISRADVVFWIGPELTPWLATALSNLGAEDDIPLLDQSVTITLLLTDTTSQGTRPDPHAWLDPDNAIAWVGVIAGRLARLDPANAATYRRNAERTKARIAAARAKAAELLSSAAELRLVFPHDAFGYFARRFDLTVAGTLANSDASPPSAARIRTLRKNAVSGKIDCVFIELGQSPAMAQTIASGTDLAPRTLDPLGYSLPLGPDLYPHLILNLARTIATCTQPVKS